MAITYKAELRQIEVLHPDTAYAVTLVITSGLPGVPYSLDDVLDLVDTITAKDEEEVPF